ncbi:MAG: amidase domain-containing protein [Clostridia bacterium]|nr:amidase domain-containing protein [Clostridia bacterium]
MNVKLTVAALAAIILAFAAAFLSFWFLPPEKPRIAAETVDPDEILTVEDGPEDITVDTEVTVSVRNDMYSFGVTEAMNAVISDYFKRYYTSIGMLEYQSMDDLYYFDTRYERELTASMQKYYITTRSAMTEDLRYNRCAVGLEYTGAEYLGDGSIRIELMENHEIDFLYLHSAGITSYSCGIEHTFVLHPIEDEFSIVSHFEISGVYKMLAEAFDKLLDRSRLTLKTMDDARIRDQFAIMLEKLCSECTDTLEKMYALRDEYNADPASFAVQKTADHPYDPGSALAYSYTWANKYDMIRNSDHYGVYDNLGGNCNNFTSQCLFAGGIPMDCSGTLKAQWKWYSDGIDASQTAAGRSMSWTGVDEFYEYCLANTGFGLVCEPHSNIYSGRPGDIIEYIVGKEAVHSVIITKVVTDKNGNVIDYLINSNTTDRVEYPMSAYGYTKFRLIRIVGWND